MMRTLDILKELRRRRVLRSVTLYAVAAWVIIQVTGIMLAGQDSAEAVLKALWTAASLGLPLVLVFAWFFDISLQGITRTAPADPDAEFELALHLKDVLIVTVMVILLGLIASGAARHLLNGESGQEQPTEPNPPASAR